MLNAYEQRGRWINTLQDFCFKIVRRTCFIHTNVDVLSRNLVDIVDEQKDLIEEIQDCKLVKPSCSLEETFWIGRSSKMGVIL